MSLDKTTKGIIVALAVFLILAIVLSGWLLITDQQGKPVETAAVVSDFDETAVPPTADVVNNNGQSGEPAALPPAIVVELPTDTPPPATNTPIPTETPTASPVPATETPVPVNTPVPIIPTNTSIPPTDTPVPTAPPQIGVSGLVASHFVLQPRSEFNVNKDIWFEFTVSNSTGGDVPYNAIGVMPRKDGVDQQAWYQQTYGGPSAKIRPGGLTWEDHIKIPEAGNFTLRLVICFDGFDNCLAGGGTWHSLSQEIPVTIN